MSVDPGTGKRRLSGKIRIVLILAGVLVLAGLLVFANLRHGTAGARGGGPVVSVVTARKESIATTVLATGRLEPRDSQEVDAPYEGGVLTTLNVKDGDRVRAGEVLATFDTAGVKLQLAQDEDSVRSDEAGLVEDAATVTEDQVSLRGAQGKVQRTAALVRAGASTRVDLENDQAAVTNDQAVCTAARAQLSQARVQLQLAQLTVRRDEHQLAQSVFTADRDGMVLISPYKVGDYVASGDQMMVIGSPGRLEIKARVDESDSGGLKPGLSVRFSCPALPDQHFPARITLVSPSATEQSLSSSGQTQTSATPAVAVTAVPTGSVAGLRPGYSADLIITTASAPAAVVVPYDAVVGSGNQEKVFVVKNGVVHIRRVRTGVSNDLDVQITSGLLAGETVILKPPPGLADGSPVTARTVNTG